MTGTRYELEINAQLPQNLSRLRELANDLRYSWDTHTQALFSRLDVKVWLASGHSPKVFLNCVEQHRLDAAAEDPEFLGSLSNVLATYDAYHSSQRSEQGPRMDEPGNLVAYFCAEFGFHESLPIYSGGLGILAGDHCKTASDMMLPFVGVGLLYRQGYFHQTINEEGRQTPLYHDSNFDDLPISPALGKNGDELYVDVAFPGRNVHVKVWRVQVGVVTLYLLDTDIESNSAHDRDITHRLYGGDRNMRLEQEIILGIGGVRALRTLELQPTVWHINEGHAAFLILERIQQLALSGLDFPTALEGVASNTVFTTHTAVPAGHDHFSEEMIRLYFADYAERMGGIESLLALGREDGTHEFNMTALAIRGSRHQNGVSKIHGEVSSTICAGMWPQIDPEDNPISSITNGVHAPSFLSELWQECFNRHLSPRWHECLAEPTTWQGVQEIPDHEFWDTRQSIKAQMLHLVRYQLHRQHCRSHDSQAHLDRLLKHAVPDNPNILTIGFARRFATYKRATLLFQNLDLLQKLVSNPDRPLLFIFAGKAHPADEPGQALIRRIAEVAAMPEFESHILLLEGYDIHLARRLVAGVDVWLNNPLYPLEASGTSGMKAGLNGVINLSVLDGWWAEGYDPGNSHSANGWAIPPASTTFDEDRRSHDEVRTLYELLQDKVIPLYYDRQETGYSSGWIAMAKQSIMTIAPQFNSHRMVGEYVTRCYRSAAIQWQRYSGEQFAPARAVAEWKKRVRDAWAGVKLRWANEAERRVPYGQSVRVTVAVSLNGLRPEDVKVELLLAPAESEETPSHPFTLEHKGVDEATGDALFAFDLTPSLCGKLEYRIRAYPWHELLTHRFETGMTRWL